MESKLTGRHRVLAPRPARADVQRLCYRVADRMEIRRHALKLRFWPDAPPDSSGGLLDLDWEWVRGLPSGDVGELRIRDVIAGHDNLRIIFHVGGKLKLHMGDKLTVDEMGSIWILRVFQKKRNDFSASDLEIFRQRRRDVRRLFYGEGSG